MRKAIVTAVLAAVAAGAMGAAAWSAQQSEQPGSGFQPKAYFIMPLEKDPSRIVRLQTVTLPPGAANQFHRHPGRSVVGRAGGRSDLHGEGPGAAHDEAGRLGLCSARHGPPQPESVRSDRAFDRAQHHRQGRAADGSREVTHATNSREDSMNRAFAFALGVLALTASGATLAQNAPGGQSADPLDRCRRRRVDAVRRADRRVASVRHRLSGQRRSRREARLCRCTEGGAASRSTMS